MEKNIKFSVILDTKCIVYKAYAPVVVHSCCEAVSRRLVDGPYRSKTSLYNLQTDNGTYNNPPMLQWQSCRGNTPYIATEIPNPFQLHCHGGGDNVRGMECERWNGTGGHHSELINEWLLYSR